VPEHRSLIRETPLEERPRERLIARGTGALSEAELLAVLLRIGHKGASAVELGQRLLRDYGGLPGLLDADMALLDYYGLGPAKVAALLAAVEIGRRLARAPLAERRPLTRPAEVARYVVLQYQRRDQEVMGALYLDVRHCLIADREIFRGTLHRAAVEPRVILKECLLRGAAGLALFHTHPSGDPTPSAEDVLFTRRMAEAAAVIGVELVDHLVVGATGRWVSLRERGAW
jgi:DNA repair protein RadC